MNILRLLLLVFITSILTQISFGQVILFSEDFKTVDPGWLSTGDLGPNTWIVNDCAGNGPTVSGDSSLYISQGGVDPDCGPTGQFQYTYTNAPTGINSIIAYHTIDATCAENLEVKFDYKIEGVPGEDYCEVIYSTDGGTSWTPVGTPLAVTAAWSTPTLSLPSLLDYSSFELGFRFTYNASTVTGIPPAVDNISVLGSDLVPPVMSCPTSLDLVVDGSCQAICDDYSASMLTLSDNCTDSADIAITQDIPIGTLFASGPGATESITLTATDASGNSSQCTFDLNVVDTIVPVVTCPGDTNIYVDNNCDGILGDYTGSVVYTDNCSSFANLTIDQSPAAGLLINGSIVVTPVTMTIEDESGNIATCVFDARTIDTMVATITCPIDTVVYANSSCEGQLENYIGDAVASDNCIPSSSLTITQSPVPGTVISADQSITLTVSGAIPNIDQSCTFTAQLVDTISPQLICPSPVNLYVNGSCEGILPDYTSGGALVENCDPSPTITQFPLPGSTIPLGPPTTVTLTVTDASGNTGTCDFVQPIVDTISPVVSCPIDQDVVVDNSCQGVLGDYLSLFTNSDNCTVTPAISQSPLPGTTINANTTVILTAEDDSGNTSSCSFNANLIDTFAPDITCPPNTSVTADASCQSTLSDYTSSAAINDNCTPTVSLLINQSPAPGSIIGSGVTAVVISAEDASGNTSNCSFNVTVEDNSQPTIISCGSNQSVFADASCEGTLGDYSSNVNASDNCSATVDLTVVQSPLSGTVITGNTSVQFEVSDEAGNTTTCSITVSVNDTIDPQATCPVDQVVSINSSCDYTLPDLTSLLTGSDNCSALGDMTVTQNPAAGTTQNGTTAVLMTLTDESGNSATCITNVIPDDNDPPTITCPSPAPIDNGTSCEFTLPNYGTMSGVLDNCSNYIIDQLPAPGTIVNPGSTLIELIVTDAGGNTDQCSFVLEVFENTTPTITCPTDVVSCDPVITYSLPIFNDNCFSFITQTDATGLSSGSIFPVGTTTLEYTVSDSSNNTQTCTFDVEVLSYPSPAVISVDTLFLCNESSAVIDADPLTGGTGEWQLESGQLIFNNQFANTTGINNVGIGTSIVSWTISTASCGETSDTLVIINTLEDVQASTQDTLYACSDAQVLLEANTPLYGVGTWSTNDIGVIDNVNSSVTNSTVANGWQEFIWTITNGSCPATSDTVHVFAIKKPSIDQSDTIICLESDYLLLTGTTPLEGQYPLWNLISGAGTVLDPTNDSTGVTGLSNLTSLFTYELTNPNCPSESDTISAVGELCDGFNPIIPTVFTPGNLDGSNDIFNISFLDVIYPECHVTIFNRWGSVVYESTGYSDPWNGTHQGEPLPMGTYFYKIELNDGSGKVLQGDISIIR